MRRCAQVLYQAGASVVARSAPAPLAPVARAALAAAAPQAAPAAGFAASRAYSSDKPVVTDFEHATGLELKELEAAAKGVDLFDHFGFLDAPFGTEEDPVQVTSVMPYRVVGATDPDDDSIVHWGRVEAGAPPMKIGEEWFVHKAIDEKAIEDH